MHRETWLLYGHLSGIVCPDDLLQVINTLEVVMNLLVGKMVTGAFALPPCSDHDPPFPPGMCVLSSSCTKIPHVLFVWVMGIADPC